MYGPELGSTLSFVSNNVFAYTSSCYHFTQTIFGVKRASNGSITELNINGPYPTPPSGDFYYPYLAAADPYGHRRSTLHGKPGGGRPYQIASCPMTSTANLTTTSTYANMPKKSVGTINDYRMSPSGKFLAVGGSAGMQICHFNGASPATKYTGVLTTSPVDQMFWDKAIHLYAISRKGGKLYVFTVTPTGVAQAAGSPHVIKSPQNIIVLPKT